MAIDSEVKIYNLALNAVGERSNISSPTENSRRAEVCNLWYEPVREAILAGAPWPEATKFQYLALSNEQDDNTWTEDEARPGYQFLYKLPSDCLRPQYLTDFAQFLLGNLDDNQRTLHTNTEKAVLAYTANITNVSVFAAELRMAIVYGLAAHICMPLTGKTARAESMLRKSNDILMAARESASNASNEQHEHIPDWISARGYSTGITQKYYYPTGSLLSLTNVN